MTQTLLIDKTSVGCGSRTFVIAEIGQAHDGSLGTAHAYIDAIADVGADAVKFQTHIAAAESTMDEKFRVNFSRQDETRFEYWKRMEFSPEQWRGLMEHAKDRGLVFLSSPFSLQAVKLLDDLGVPAWKIGSGELYSTDLMQAVLESRKPALISSGMSSFSELAEVVQPFEQHGVSYALFQCASKYPVPLSEVGINVIEELRARFACPVGLSDHSGTVYPGLAAMGQRADLLEIHVVFDRRTFGPDVPASVTVEELSLLVKAASAFHEMYTHPVDKDDVASSMTAMKALFNKSVALRRDLCSGDLLTSDVLTLKKPGSGIPAKEIDSLIGKKLVKNVDSNRLLKWDDIER